MLPNVSSNLAHHMSDDLSHSQFHLQRVALRRHVILRNQTVVMNGNHKRTSKIACGVLPNWQQLAEALCPSSTQLNPRIVPASNLSPFGGVRCRRRVEIDNQYINQSPRRTPFFPISSHVYKPQSLDLCRVSSSKSFSDFY